MTKFEYTAKQTLVDGRYITNWYNQGEIPPESREIVDRLLKTEGQFHIRHVGIPKTIEIKVQVEI